MTGDLNPPLQMQPSASDVYTDVSSIRKNVAVLLRYVTNHGKLRPNKDLIAACAQVLSATSETLRADSELLAKLYDCNERLSNLAYPATASTVLQAFEAKTGLPYDAAAEGSSDGRPPTSAAPEGEAAEV